MSGKTKDEKQEDNRDQFLALKKGPNLDQYLVGRKRRLVSYAQGAQMYSLNYYSFVKLAKESGANIRIRKSVVVDLSIIEEYLKNK